MQPVGTNATGLSEREAFAKIVADGATATRLRTDATEFEPRSFPFARFARSPPTPCFDSRAILALLLTSVFRDFASLVTMFHSLLLVKPSQKQRARRESNPRSKG